MGFHMSKVSIVEIVLQVFTVLVLCTTSTSADPTASFIFGDSLVDVGNNNYLNSFSKANFKPNGIDFGGPTGRFTNGRTILDIIDQELGLGSTPPYLAPSTTGPAILKGVNYASGAGGILNRTGATFGARLSFDAQIGYFAKTRLDIIASIGLPKALNLLERALFSVTIGSNDFINNYLNPSPMYTKQKSAPPEVFVNMLISKLDVQLTMLYNLGARKMVVANVGPIGCIPNERDRNLSSGDNCVEFPNQLAQLYNKQLRGLINKLSSDLVGSVLLYADVYRILEDILRNYTTLGFENPSFACCNVAGRYGGLIPCTPASTVCESRTKYVFWDPYHPSDAANAIIAKNLLDGGSEYISPTNIRQLFQ